MYATIGVQTMIDITTATKCLLVFPNELTLSATNEISQIIEPGMPNIKKPNQANTNGSVMPRISNSPLNNITTAAIIAAIIAKDNEAMKIEDIIFKYDFICLVT